MAFAGANFGTVLKTLAAAIPSDRPALVHGNRVVRWSELDALTDRIAAGLTARGLKPGDIAGQMLRNTPDYLLAWFGCVKAGVVPVNVNYHYRQRELADIVSRFGLKALFSESEFAAAARDAMPAGTLTVDIGSAEWARLCDSVVPDGFAVHDNPEALFLTATGGTTGMPKAVMWPMDQAWQAFNIGVWQRPPGTPPLVVGSLE
jgi:3-oxocholest-4-en-26-oate---CoA ligase